jgi:hypothetical protein
MRYHWSLLTFGILYTLLLVTVLCVRFCLNRPLPRKVSFALIALMLLLGLVRFCCCVCGVQDCPLTIGGMKQTSTLMVVSIMLILLLTVDVPLGE